MMQSTQYSYKSPSSEEIGSLLWVKGCMPGAFLVTSSTLELLAANVHGHQVDLHKFTIKTRLCYRSLVTGEMPRVATRGM
jgi:hypothetical protein